MANNPLTEIVMAAANLKAAAPQHYAALMDAVRAYEKQAIIDMVSGETPHEIFRAQGGVKILSTLRKHLTECAELRDQYNSRRT